MKLRCREYPEKFDLSNAESAADFIREKKAKPFFLSFGMFNTHREFVKNDNRVNPAYVMPPHPMYDNEENRLDMAGFIASAKVADHCAGIVLDAVREAGLEDDTLIFYTTDHGIAFPKMKCTLYDTGIGVSLIMKMPGMQIKGVALDSLVSQLDIFPTICDFLHIEKPSWLEGVSMMPLLQGESKNIREEIFAEVSYHGSYEPMRCIRTQRYKLIRYYDDYDRIIPSDIDDGYSKRFLLDHGLLDQPRDREMLFDLFHDPVERVNLIGSRDHLPIYNDLSARLDAWMKNTGDPLLAGAVPMPAGATVNTRTCISPVSEDPEDYITL